MTPTAVMSHCSAAVCQLPQRPFGYSHALASLPADHTPAWMKARRRTNLLVQHNHTLASGCCLQPPNPLHASYVQKRGVLRNTQACTAEVGVAEPLVVQAADASSGSPAQMTQI